MLSIVERQVHKGETGNKETPSQRQSSKSNSKSGMDKLRQAQGITFSQLLAVLEGCARTLKQA